MTTPDESGPVEPPVVPEEAAAQDVAADAEAAAAAQRDAIRELATEIAKQAILAFDPATVRKSAVTAIATTATPPTLSVQISGDTTTTIDGVRYIDSYAPVGGDTVLIIKAGHGPGRPWGDRGPVQRIELVDGPPRGGLHAQREWQRQRRGPPHLGSRFLEGVVQGRRQPGVRHRGLC
ncbi:hypothetical protein OG785_32160 [Streptomyces sp. NBC_00006]|uniref:hypothetical protein n=1 Tax=Streptomyces sp. NBC_00006 TaxID=2975619 RepID=UPI00225086EF|nr:hypothetical protein [Streptomyces sp. NBC_00006]MCX5535195.1 hypothetical protein [Streptomyces sp. NBC_00006]